VASGISRDIIPACRETPVRDVLNQHTVGANNLDLEEIAADLGEISSWY